MYGVPGSWFIEELTKYGVYEVCLLRIVYTHFLRWFRLSRRSSAEYQQKMVAWHSAAKIRRFFISYDFGQPDYEQDGLMFIKSFRLMRTTRDRIFHPRLTKLWRALKYLMPCILYTSCRFSPGMFAVFCKMYGNKYIFAAAHDFDFIPEKVQTAGKRSPAIPLRP